MALVVRAELTIKEVKTFADLHPLSLASFETFKLIRLVEQQIGGLDMLELSILWRP